MAQVSIYLNFQGNTEEAFNFYKRVFNSEFNTPIIRMGDMPGPEGAPQLSDEEKNKVMHVSMPIIGGTRIMATDMLESMGHKVVIGNNTTINLDLDTKEDADKYYGLLSEGSTECMPMSQQPWGYWGVCLDRFGIRWMFNVMNKQ
ncbi:3-demethylubiquinone-9 3-methyltransferase [Flavobacterium enshiense DK69]|uniref:Glyoxalase n=1 Tax=Flavobacterium enshiense DK69 TaxID=1107311 RepID=V6S837_9FLAO|nr:VOC family protein [Flavobacterium enshiense]ESU22427.1 3-demethylubiquinone-9 3-methyltransferase [Flavobacterium enshiense DK69]KGO97429.1 glyoxalase [Flavobacterium enshiense DK69]